MSEWIKAKAMTRNEVIKAMECCTSGNIENCQICPVEAQSELPTHYCITVLLCEALALLKEKHRCSDCAHQSRGICARTGCPTRPDVWCDEWEART